jgi:hypothetical protein
VQLGRSASTTSLQLLEDHRPQLPADLSHDTADLTVKGGGIRVLEVEGDLECDVRLRRGAS